MRTIRGCTLADAPQYRAGVRPARRYHCPSDAPTQEAYGTSRHYDHWSARYSSAATSSADSATV